MIKRIKFIIVAVLLLAFLFPASALANDAPAFTDSRDYLSVDIKTDKKAANIGEDIQITLTFKNNTSYPITIYKIYEIFENTFIYDEYYDYDNPKSLKNLLDNLLISPGEKIQIVIDTIVPDNIDWYIKDDDYYTNIQISTEFDVFFEGWYESIIFKPVHRPFPIKITNIYDGSEFIQMNLIEDNTTFYFPIFNDAGDSSYSSDFLYSQLNKYDSIVMNKVNIRNISNKSISDIIILDAQYNKDVIEVLLPNQENEKSYIIYKGFLQKNIPDTLNADYKIAFIYEEKYYAVNITKTYPTKILIPSEVTVALLDINEDTKSPDYDYLEFSKVVAITNISNETIKYLYFDTEGDTYYEPVFYNDPNNIIKNLPSNHTVYLPCRYKGDFKDWSYYIGYITENDLLYFWHLDVKSYKDDDENIIEKAVYDVYTFQFLPPPHMLIPLSEKPTPTPILTTTPTPSPTPNKTAIPTPTPSPTPTPASTVSPTIKPTEEPTIEVVHVKKSSSIPFWVWIVLPIAIIAAGIIIFIIRKKKGAEILENEKVNNPTNDD